MIFKPVWVEGRECHYVLGSFVRSGFRPKINYNKYRFPRCRGLTPKRNSLHFIRYVL
jgi:hypothetical protein